MPNWDQGHDAPPTSPPRDAKGEPKPNLRLCPHCEGLAHVQQEIAFWIECEECSARSAAYPTLELAVAAWNKRADDLHFDLQWKAEMRGIAMWQAEAPGRELTWPDKGEFVAWLLKLYVPEPELGPDNPLVIPGARVRHLKRGSSYVVLGMAKHEADWSDEVAYRPLDGGPIINRPLAEFCDGRFELISEHENQAQDK